MHNSMWNLRITLRVFGNSHRIRIPSSNEILFSKQDSNSFHKRIFGRRKQGDALGVTDLKQSDEILKHDARQEVKHSAPDPWKFSNVPIVVHKNEGMPRPTYKEPTCGREILFFK